MSDVTSPDAVEALFTRADGQFLFARWGRPIVPVVFGVEDASISILKGAIEAVVALADHKMAEHDPELGANLMVFFLRDWNELRDLPGLSLIQSRSCSLVGNCFMAPRYHGGPERSWAIVQVPVTTTGRTSRL